MNDNFANRIVLFGTNVALNADNTFATLEPGEATLSSNLDSKTLWWSWTASQNGSVQLKARNLECRLTVFTGLTFTSLNLVASATANSFYLGNQMYFLAQAGTTYQIAVDGFNGASGLIDFSLKFNVSPYVFSIPYLSLAKGASNTMQLNLLADPGQRVRLEGSSDLLRWNTNGVVIGPTTITLSNTNQAKFMRAVVE